MSRLAEIENQIPLFDMSELTPSTSYTLETIASDIKSLDGSAAIAMIVKGRRLLEAKDALLKARHPLLSRPGGFYLWAKSELGYSKRTAKAWIRCAEAMGEVDDKVIAQFDVVALRQLVSTATPEGARKAALDAARQGDRISSDRADEIISAYRLAKKRQDEPLQIGQVVTTTDGRRITVAEQLGGIIRGTNEQGEPAAILWNDIDRTAAQPTPPKTKPSPATDLLKNERDLLRRRVKECESLLRAAADRLDDSVLREEILGLLGDT